MRTPKSIKEDKALLDHLSATMDTWRNDLQSLNDLIGQHRRTLATNEARAAHLTAALAGAERIIEKLKGEDK